MNNTRNYYSQYRNAEGSQDMECCSTLKVFPKEISAAMAYVPFQQWCDVYQCEKALCQGTVFPILDLPFMGVRQR